MSSEASFVIRPATDEDWPQIWPFFAAIVRDGRTYAYPPDITSDEARTLWMSSEDREASTQRPPARTVVAVDAGTGAVLGSAKMGPNRPGRGAHISTASFMVAPAAQGRGVGRALGRHVVDQARADGYHGMQFNAVVETNRTAVALWRSLGFEILATVPEAFDHADDGLVGLHVMYQRL